MKILKDLKELSELAILLDSQLSPEKTIEFTTSERACVSMDAVGA